MMMRLVSSSLVCRAVVGGVFAFWVAGCATERLDAAAPSGVNLAGNWTLNLNLSDDPDKLGPDPDKTPPQHAPGTHRGHGGGGGRGGGGMPGSPGSPDDGPGNFELGPTASNGVYGGSFLPVALSAPGIEQSAPLPPTTGTASGTTTTKPSRGASINRLLRAPLTLSITQDKATVIVKATMPDGAQTADEYTAGTKSTIPLGEETAERTAGWRGPVFVVTTTAKKFGTREDDFGIDEDDGRLIMNTQTKGGRLGKVEIKRVYDRVKPAQP
jgi:hypothetical protein